MFAALWIGAFIWFLWFPKYQVYSAADIEGMSRGVVVNVSRTVTPDQSAQTGFWVTPLGHVVTIQRALADRKPDAHVALLLPPAHREGVLVGGGLLSVRATEVRYEGETGIRLLRVPEYPMPRGAVGTVDGRTIAQSNAPKLLHFSTNPPPNIGAKLYLVATEPMEGAPPDLVVTSVNEGIVTRAGFDLARPDSAWRLFTSLPFKSAYVGAPVLDDSARIVGVVDSEGSAATAAVLPISHVAATLDAEKITSP